MNILLADDHGLFRDSMSIWLQQYPDNITISLASDWSSLQGQLQPTLDLIMLDLAMPGMSGASSIMKLRKQLSHVPVLVVSANEDPMTIQACLDAGAAGYNTKASEGSEILNAVTTVLKGEIYRCSTSSQTENTAAQLLFSKKQFELLTHLANGQSNKVIAADMGLSEGTIKQYVSKLLTLLEVDNRTQAGYKARDILGFNAN